MLAALMFLHEYIAYIYNRISRLLLSINYIPQPHNSDQDSQSEEELDDIKSGFDLIYFYNLFSTETNLKLRLVQLVSNHWPGLSIFISLALLVVVYTHIHVLAVRRAVFGNEEPDALDEEDFNPFEFEYGEIRIDFADDSDDNDENRQSSDSDDDTDDNFDNENNEDEDNNGDGDMLRNEAVLNATFLAVTLLVALVNLEIQKSKKQLTNPLNQSETL